MKYLNILDCDIADGEGIRVTLFVSGCGYHCFGCHNPESWDPNNGKEFTEETVETILKLLNRDYIDGITITGGDPLYPLNREAVTRLCRKIKETYPNKNIWLYTGYNYEEVMLLDVFNYIDVVVDGQFELDKRDITLPFRGSSNQKIIRLDK